MDTKELRERWRKMRRYTDAAAADGLSVTTAEIMEMARDDIITAILSDIEAQGWRVVKAADYAELSRALHEARAIYGRIPHLAPDRITAEAAHEMGALIIAALKLVAPQGEKR